MFQHYDDPFRAKRIFYEYAPDWRNISVRGGERILEVIGINKSFDDLDIALDRILTGHAFLRMGGGSLGYVEDIDCDGSWSNCVRALEG